MKLKEILIKAFNEGSDNFGESINDLQIISIDKIGDTNSFYIIIRIDDEEYYIFLYSREDKYDIYSGHIVFAIDKTVELEEELKEYL